MASANTHQVAVLIHGVIVLQHTYLHLPTSQHTKILHKKILLNKTNIAKTENELEIIIKLSFKRLYATGKLTIYLMLLDL